MILDNEQQREALIQLIRSSTFSGDQIGFVHELYQAIKSAIVRPELSTVEENRTDNYGH